MQQLQHSLQEHQTDPDSEGLNLSYLERSRGFLVHMKQVYPALTPYLKGLNLTIDSWRDNRDDEGWRMPKLVDSYPEGNWDNTFDDTYTQLSRPQLVSPVPRYAEDLQALQTLLEPDDPPLRFVRQRKIHTAFYGFVDASAGGLEAPSPPRGAYITPMAYGERTRPTRHQTTGN